ncbi:MAG: imidazole glycerol phosphate synthase subunit HisH [Candidatus Omnitrophica bacterium]|nr:imidazole glycerol phosphate synthase subunit HisH [Candidatus Omnitrophota bacterium]
MQKIAIINYGMGNLKSVYNAFSLFDSAAYVADYPSELEKAEKIVLPGVGSFYDGMKNLRTNGWLEALEKHVVRIGKPFMGVCLGMQLLATCGDEGGLCNGLGWVEGAVEKLRGGESVRIPHIGWNDVQFIKKDKLYADLKGQQTFYFVHSYVFTPKNRNVISGTFSYGDEYAASIEKNNICATQFHPEKSQKAGLSLIKNFLTKY